MYFLQMPAVKFFLRSNNDLIKSHVLYCRISYNNTTAEFSTREKLDPLYWDQHLQQAKTPSKSQTKYINFLIESFTYKIKYLFLDQRFRKSNAKEIIKTIFSSEAKEITLKDLIEKYISETKYLSPGTKRNDLIKQNNFLLYEKSCQAAFTPATFTPVNANDFLEWFKRTKKTENNTSAVRNVQFFKNVMQWALNKGEISDFALKNYTAKKDKIKEAIFLTQQEYEHLKNFRCNPEFHNKVKDLFLFQCVTGLSYCDLWSWEIVTKNNIRYIAGKRNKNGNPFMIPLDSEVQRILEKYSGRLPYYQNIVYNRILKEIAKETGIKKRLTTHIGRKTFATLKDCVGWSKESIALMLGHKSIKTTESYYIGKNFDRLEKELFRFTVS